MKDSYLYRTFALLFFCASYTVLLGQDNEPAILPPSPDVKSIEKFVDQRVNYFKGTPEIQVPIWSINQNSLTIPISLRYHAGGIKVHETASNVGLGWALVAGGTVSREVRGLPDDSSFGFLDNTYSVLDCPASSTSVAVEYTQDLADGEFDMEPDQFTFSFPGGSGKFVFNKDGSIHQLSQSALDISFVNSDFIITDENGTVYTFDITESSNTNLGVNYLSAWHLSKISFPGASTLENITFSYESYTTTTEYAPSQTISEPSSNLTSTNQMIITHQSKRLSEISHKTGDVEFNYGEYRRDHEGAQRLEEIVINGSNGEIKSFVLEHEYFNVASMSNISSYPATATTDANHNLRLSLKSVTEKNGPGTETKPPYEFFYETSQWLPNRVNSKAVDYWGYYNGKNSNTTLVPNYPIDYISSTYPILSEGGDRHPSETHVGAGILKKMVYPTGGYTEYEFEIHKITPSSAPQIDYTASYLINVTTVKQCDIVNSSDFTIDNLGATSAGIVVKLNLKGFVPYTNSTTCAGNQPILPGYSSRYLNFKIFNVNDLQNAVYTSSGNLTIDGTTVDETEHAYLPEGTYRVKVYRGASEAIDNDAAVNTIFNFSVTGVQFPNVDYKPAGGLRIKEINTHASAGDDPIVKKFEYLENGNESGRPNIYPDFHYDRIIKVSGINTNVDIHTSNSSALSFYEGVGYSKVTEYFGENGGNGKVERFYSNPDDLVYLDVFISSYSAYPNFHGGTLCYSDGRESGTLPLPQSHGFTFPFTPPVSNSWRRGLLEEVHTYSYQSGNYKLASKTINTYKDDYYGNPNEYNSSTDVLAERAVGGTNQYTVLQYYYVPSKLVKLVESQNTQYDLSGTDAFTQVTKYHYDDLDHLQPSRVEQVKSNGTKVFTLTLYPQDYTNTSGFIGDLKTSKIKSKPVEQVTYQTDANGSNIEILSGTINTYLTGSKVGLVDKVYRLETSSPIALSNFRFSNQSTQGVLPPGTESTFNLANIDETYPDSERIKFTYTSSTNVSNVSNSNAFNTSYMWGYNEAYPIIQGKGITHNDLSTVVGWAIGDLSLVGVSTLEDLLEHIGDMADSNKQDDWNDFIEALHGYTDTVGAVITTMTYEPGIGMTSQTTPNRLITYYEYDDFGRLEYVRDKDGNILKKNEYKYQVQIQNTNN